MAIGIVAEATGPFPPTGIRGDGTIVNAASVESPGTNCPPGSPPDDVCDAEVALPIGPTIAIAKTSSATQIVPGATVTYTLTVTNTGAADASGVVVQDTLPVGLTFVSADHPSCTAWPTSGP